jgi:hypothetical protein
VNCQPYTDENGELRCDHNDEIIYENTCSDCEADYADFMMELRADIAMDYQKGN